MTTSASAEALRTITTFGLSSAGIRRGRAARIDEGWYSFLGQLGMNKLLGVAAAAEMSGVLLLADDQRGQLIERHREAMLWCLALERQLLELADAFQAAGVEFAVLKGPAVAHTMYPDPSWRGFVDLDLLVRPQAWRPACDALANLGLRRSLPEPRPAFDERFGKAAVFKRADGPEIDLHRTLVLGAFGLWIDPDELFDHTVPFAFGGRRLMRLDDTAMLLHAFLHAAIGEQEPTLMPLRDVAQIQESGAVDWELFKDLATHWRLRAVIGYVARMLKEQLGVLPLPQVDAFIAGAQRIPFRERRALQELTTDRRERGGITLSPLWGIRGTSDKISYVRALLLPSREFLFVRTGAGERSPYLRRWATPLHWLGNGRAK